MPGGSRTWEMPRRVSEAGRSFPGTDRLARRWPEMPNSARHLDPPVGGRGHRSPRARPSPVAPRPRGPQIPQGELGTQGLAGSWVPFSISRASFVLGDPRPQPPVALLPPRELGPPGRRASPLLSAEGLFPTNQVGRCRWNRPVVEGSCDIPLPWFEPPYSTLPYGGVGPSLEPPELEKEALCSPTLPRSVLGHPLPP